MMSRRAGRMTLPVLALVASTLIMAPAHAATTRYAAPGRSDANPCTLAAPCDVVTAVTGAASGDTVLLAPGRYSVGSSISTSSAVSIRPQVAGTRPVISFTGSYSFSLHNAAAVVEDIRIESLAITSLEWALRLQPGVGRRLEVVADGTSAGGAVLSDGASLIDSTVWSRSAGSAAINSGPQGATFRNVTAIATGSGSAGFFTNDGYTLTGGASVTFQNSIVRGVAFDYYVYSASAAEPIAVSIDHGNYLTTYPALNHATITDLGGHQTALPAFVSAATGDLRQQVVSPTRDAGAPVPGLSVTALDGQARVQGAGVDIGADEVDVTTASVIGVKLNKRKGIARLTVALPAAGTLTSTGRKVRPASVTAGAGGGVVLVVKPTRAGMRKLRRTGRLRVSLVLGWAPDRGVGVAPAPYVVRFRLRH